MAKRLWIPGPVEVSPEILNAMGTPMVGHRSKEYSELHKNTRDKLKKLLFTDGHVFISTSSAWGVMEGAVRNLVSKRVLNCMCGAFSDKWHPASIANGKEADPLRVEWGQPILPEQIDEALSTGKYDALTLVYNETSTGVMSPIDEIADVMTKYPDVMFIVDSVSIMTSVKIEPEKLGIDVLLAGVQKAFGLPPGIAVFYVSQKALDKAKTVENRGYYFDFLEFLKSDQKDQTPTTPSISHIYALNIQLDRMFAEGLDNRFARHQQLAETCREWANEYFECFAPEGYRSPTLTAVRNTRETDVGSLIKELAENHNAALGNGYGKIKDKTFRIGHMADTTLDELKQLLGWITDIITK